MDRSFNKSPMWNGTVLRYCIEIEVAVNVIFWPFYLKYKITNMYLNVPKKCKVIRYFLMRHFPKCFRLPDLLGFDASHWLNSIYMLDVLFWFASYTQQRFRSSSQLPTYGDGKDSHQDKEWHNLTSKYIRETWDFLMKIRKPYLWTCFPFV